jgi:uncharacterized repeat protein (TIGR03803 family)
MPLAPLTLGPLSGGAPVLYGVTEGGGQQGYGTAFSLTPPPPGSGGPWTETTLFTFLPQDGYAPKGALAPVTQNNQFQGFLGTTYLGGTGTVCASFPASGCGTVFSLAPPAGMPSGTPWTETVLLNFNGFNGELPYAGLVNHNGVFYGTTWVGGPGQPGEEGVVFSMTPPAGGFGGSWTQTLLYVFKGGVNGFFVESPLAIDEDGVLYGTTLYGGVAQGGTVFSLTPPAAPGGAWTFSELYQFNCNEGCNVAAGVTIGKGATGQTVLYGVTSAGGPTNNAGSVFALTPPATPGQHWAMTILHSFTGSDGSDPMGNLALGTGGVLYGTTKMGGPLNNGTVFSLQP